MAARRALFGKDSLIPAPFDPRLILRVAPAVARAAMESGVATRPIADFDAYAESLQRFVFRSGFIMRQIFAAARKAPQPRDLCRWRGRARAARRPGGDRGGHRQAHPDRPPGGDRERASSATASPSGRARTFDVVNPEDDPRYRDYVATYVEVAGRRGITPDAARTTGAHLHHGDRGARRAGAARPMP